MAWPFLKRSRLAFCVSVVPLLFPPEGRAEVRLPAIIGDHMVLQRDAKVLIWGWADPGENVIVTGSWNPTAIEAVAGTDGKWKVELQTGGAGGPYTLTVAGRNLLTINDVLLGEVWLGSGQSNMEWPVASSLNVKEEIAAATFPHIRLFTVQRASAATPQEDVAGRWEVCSPETVGRFSAVAYFFGRKLHKELGVPVGLIASSWGGTEIEKWIPETAMMSDADFAASINARKDVLAAYRSAQEAWKKENDAADAGTRGRWEDPALNDADWTTFPVYTTWTTGELAAFDGVAWFRGSFDVPAAWVGQTTTLELGAIDDQDRTYVNGVLVGATDGWTVQRVYALPGDILKAGMNSIVIRVHDTGGGGGFSPGPGQPCVRRGEQRAAIGNWKYRIGVPQAAIKPPPQPPSAENSVLYNAMIAPITPCAIRGVIWYQGESNVPRAAQYRKAFPMMIAAWRQAWGNDTMPFYFVQIAPFSGYTAWNLPAGASAELREAQRLALSMPYTGMVVTTDLVPNVDDIHPTNKQSVGHRLALWALAHDYGRKDIVPSGPIYRSMKIEGDRIRLNFDHVGSGLEARGGTLIGFTIAGEDRKFVPAQATIDGQTVVVHANGVRKPAAVRFAWEDAPIPGFFNKDGLPASPFRTDDWPLLTANMKW